MLLRANQRVFDSGNKKPENLRVRRRDNEAKGGQYSFSFTSYDSRSELRVYLHARCRNRGMTHVLSFRDDCPSR